MNKKFTNLLLFSSVLLFNALLFSQNTWRVIGPGAGSDLEAMAIQPDNPNVVYIGGDIEGIFKTTDGGLTWKNINANLGTDYKDRGNYFIQEIVVAPNDASFNTVYICTLDGLFKTTDGGESWHLVYPQNPSTEDDFIPVSYFTIDKDNPNVFWAGIGEAHASLAGKGKLLKSTDAGLTWNEIIVTAQPAVIHGIFIDPTSNVNNRTIYTSTNFGMFKSTDNGTTWVQKNNGFPHNELRRLDGAVFDNTLNLYVSLTTMGISGDPNSFNGGIYKSTNGGDSWLDISSNLPKYQASDSLFYFYWKFSLDKTKKGVIYTATTRGWPEEGLAGFEDWGVYKTTDDGQTWNDMSSNFSNGWLSPPFFDEKHAFVLDVAPSNPDIIYWGLVWMQKSTDGGNSWNQIFTQQTASGWKTTGLGFLAAEGIGFDPNDPNLVYLAYDDFGIFRSDDAANSFFPLDPRQEPYDGFDAAKDVAIDPVNGDIYLSRYEGLANATQFGFSLGQVWKSTDKGISWTSASVGLPNGRPKLIIDPNSGSPGNRTLYCASFHNGIYKSTNSGDTWAQINSGLGTDASTVWEITIDPNNSNILYAGTNAMGAGGALYKSSDAGNNWNKLSSFPTFDIFVIKIDKSTGNIFVGATDNYDYNSDGGLFKSSDEGNTWTKIFDNSRPADVEIDPGNPNNIYVMAPAWFLFNSTFQPGIFFSSDGGSSWANITDNLGHLAGKFIKLNPHNPNQLFLGSDGGDVWVRDNVTSVTINDVIPTDFSLLQNYPNPFNPSTTISYQIPYQSKVTLKIYDVLGREAKTLVNEEQPAGNYKVNFDASRLASGVYFYRITATGGASSFVQTKKMILMK